MTVKIDDCCGFDTQEDRNKFASDANAANVKWTLRGSTMTVTGDKNNVKKFVEGHWQTSTKFQPFDELIGEIFATVID